MAAGIGGLLLGFAGWGFLPALAAVITGHMAQKRQPWAKGFWLTGLITGYIGLAFSVLVILFFVVVIVIGMNAPDTVNY